MRAALITVVETAEFLKCTNKLLTNDERADIVTFLAINPDSGDVIPQTGGVRKLRWMRQGTGKRGGVRVIYYFHNETVPLFLLSAYAKNQKVDLTVAERNEMRALIPLIVSGYRRRRR
jgi:hypothetical protein